MVRNITNWLVGLIQSVKRLFWRGVSTPKVATTVHINAAAAPAASATSTSVSPSLTPSSVSFDKEVELKSWYTNQDSLSTPGYNFLNAIPFTSTFMWLLAITLLIIGGTAVYDGKYGIGGLPLVLMCWILLEGLKNPIRNRPPQVGIETVWGSPTGNVLSPGYRLLADYWPFKLSVILLDVDKYNFRVKQENVTCIEVVTKSDGTTENQPDTTLKVEVAVQISPDTSFDNLMEYIKGGERIGAESVITDTISRIIRDLGTRLTATEYMTVATPLTAYIISRLTRVPVSYIIDKQKADTWENREIIPDVFIKHATAHDAQLHKERLAEWLRELEDRGIGNIPGTGVQIYKLNVDVIDFQSEEARKQLDKIRIEHFQRTAEKLDSETKALAIKALEGISKDALEAFTILNGKGALNKTVNESRTIQEIKFIGPDGKPADPSLAQALMATVQPSQKE